MRAFYKAFVVLLCVFATAPLLWHGISSLKTSTELTRVPPTFLPEQIMENYRELFLRRPFRMYYRNSFVIAALASLLCLAAASPSACALARSRARLRQFATSILLGVAFFPPIVFLIPLYELTRAAGLVNHPWG